MRDNRSTIVLVTGAGGFVGRTLVRALAERGYCVRAGIHSMRDRNLFCGLKNVSTEIVDVLDTEALDAFMKEVDTVLHFAAMVDTTRSAAELHQVNVQGTLNVWESAAKHRVKRALLCSSAAVYGLLRRTDGMIAESSPPNAVEPYGRTKLLAESEALRIGSTTGLHTTIIRPVAIFGPGEHTPFGRSLRDAAVSKLLFAGGFHGKQFSYVHVEDVAGATIHLLEADIPSGEIFNVAADNPIPFQDAFDSYIRVLQRAGEAYTRPRLLALVSRLLHRLPRIAHGVTSLLGERVGFSLWRPGFDLLYSSAKLRATSFTPTWNDFEQVFYSCLEKDEAGGLTVN